MQHNNCSCSSKPRSPKDSAGVVPEWAIGVRWILFLAAASWAIPLAVATLL